MFSFWIVVQEVTECLVDHVISLGDVDTVLSAFEFSVKFSALLEKIQPLLLRLVELLFHGYEFTVHLFEITIQFLSILLILFDLLFQIGNLLVERIDCRFERSYVTVVQLGLALE